MTVTSIPPAPSITAAPLVPTAVGDADAAAPSAPVTVAEVDTVFLPFPLPVSVLLPLLPAPVSVPFGVLVLLALDVTVSVPETLGVTAAGVVVVTWREC